MADVVAGLAVFGAVIAVGWLLVRTRAEDCQPSHHVGHGLPLS